MITRCRNPFVLLALLVLPLGCSASGTRDNDFTPIISDKARPLADDDARNATIFPDRLEFPLASQAWLDGVSPGDVLVSGYDYGFLRRVASLENTAKAIVVYTEDAELTDIVEQGAAETVVDYASLEPASAAGFPELSPQTIPGNPAEFSYNLEGNVYPLGDGVSARITKGTISFNPTLDIGLSIKSSGVVDAHALAKGVFASELEVEIEGAWPVNITKEVEIARLPPVKVPLFIGLVPITCTASLAVKAGFTFDAKGQMKVTLAQSFNFDGEMGVRYTPDGGWEKVWSFQPNWVPQPPTFGASVQVNAKGYLGGALNLGFYAGPKILGNRGWVEVVAKPYLRAEYDSTQPAPGWGLYSGLQVDATASLEVIHIALAKTTLSLYNDETRRLPAEGSNDPAPVNEGNCSDG
ncbi:MAG TPA: hypothetical protein PKA58_37920, partial [Polyangium sp.]|nr:hypothetical protein [Polyangium sp.]